MTNKTKRTSLLNSSSLFVLGTASVLLGSGPAQAFDANSLPTGGSVTGGSATIATSGNTLTVNQASNRAIIDWRSFNIGANAQANFVQPGTSSIAVNRVNGSTDPSRIDGGLHANGQVWVLNPNGVFFGKTARVDAAGVVATTANINDKAFMAGSNKLQMTGGDNGQVVNEGHISVGEGGLAAFVAPSVRNSGTIRARLGKVTLAAGDTYTLDLAGDRLVEIGLGSNKAVVDQSGKIVNAGGVIEISAKAASQVVDAVINTSGVTDASSVRSVGGKIVLGGDVINVASTAKISADGTTGGQITAVANKTGNYAGSYSAQGTTGDGGQIETSGKTVHIDNKIAVNTKSAKGKTGNWTLDPDDLTVQAGSGGNVNDTSQSTVGADTVVAALNTTDVTLQAKTSITVASAVDASGNANAHNLALNDQDGGGLTINLNAAITLKSGGTLSGQGTTVNVDGGLGGLAQNGIDVATRTGTSTVNLASATYNEALSITTSNLTLNGSGSTIAPTALLDTHTGHKYDTDVKTALFVNGATGVTLNGLNIDGGTLGANAVVFWNNASGTISNSGIYNETTLNGGQTGQGLAVDATGTHTATLLVDTVDFQGFNKNAIDAVTGGGATNGGGNIALTVNKSTITGAGDSIPTIAQNGILVWERGGSGSTVSATLDHDTFSDLGYADPTTATAAGVLVYGVQNGAVSVSNSTFTNVQEYVSTAGSAHEVDATTGNIFDGVLETTASLSDLFAIENHMNHGTEDASTSLVRVKAGNVYVTQAKGDIQDSVDAASAGDIVNVQAGTYRTQVVIDKNLTVAGAGAGSTIIESPDVLTHGFTYAGVARNAVVSVEDADNVAINNLTIDGRGQAAANGAFVGLGLHNAGGTIENVTITRVRSGGEAGTLGGGQTVYGLAAFNDTGTHTVDFEASQIKDFEKDGAAFYGHGLDVLFNSNTITGAGPTTANAQNGVVLIGATGAVVNSTFNGIGYSPDTFWATAIYLSNSAGSRVQGNTVNGAGGLTGSTLGLYVASSDNVEIDNNHFLNVEEGIDLAATNANINNNHFLNSANGIEIEASATGASISDNEFGNNLTHVVGSDASAVSGLLANNSFDRSVVATGGANIYGDLQTAIDSEVAGSTLNLAGTFGSGANINKAGDSLVGTTGALIQALNDGDNGLTISADDVTVSGLEIAGPAATTSYLTYAWNNDITRGIVVDSSVQNFTITGNNIHGTRNNILVNGLGNTGSITGNTIDNSKSGISVQYTDGAGIDISGNKEGTFGNEWGMNLHLNGHYDDSNVYHPNGDKIAATPDFPTQDQILADSLSNHGWSVQDQGYSNANRSAVTVATTGNDANQGSGLNSLATIQAGINAVVDGGTVNVKAGTYDQALDIEKALNLTGAGAGQTIIKPTTLLDTGVGHKYDADVQAAVFVNGVGQVNISGVTIDSNNPGANATVFWNNAGGSIKDSEIANSAAALGPQTGQGIALDAAGEGYQSNLLIDNVAFHDWSKNAIDAVTGNGATSDGGDISLTVKNSTFTGQGATGLTAQNGILLWERGGGSVNATIDNSTFKDLGYTDPTTATAAGVLLYGVHNGTVTISNSTFTNVQEYVSTADSVNEVNATDGNTFDGVAADTATLDQLFAIENQMNHGTEDASTSLVRVKAGNVYVTAAKGDIQDSVDVAAVGDTVNVQAGTYRTQVVIAKDLSLVGAGAGSTIIESPDVLTHSFSSGDATTGGPDRKAVVSVEGGTVGISGLTIDGRAQGSANQYFADLGVHNASANIDAVRLTGATDTVLDGAQHGVGLAVFNDDNVSRTVTLSNSAIDNFQKNGAAFYGHGLTANVTGNTITGAGSISTIAQNGIVLSGATGNVTGNTLSGISYSPDTVWATAIYLNDSAGTTVSGNTVTGAGGLAGSTLGVYAGNSAGAQITGNSFNGVEEGIDLATNATVTGNTFKNSANGIEIEASAAGAIISGNTFTNNLTHVVGSDASAVSGLLANNTIDKTVIATGGASIYGDVNTAISSEAAGSTLNLSANHFAAGIVVNQDGDKLVGTAGTVIDALHNGDNGITIAANNVTIGGLEIAGPASDINFAWGSDITRGIVVARGATGFAITGNNIHGTRNNILVDGIGNTGSITGNTIAASKSGISVQYTDGSGINISGNTDGGNANEWGVNLHLNGHSSDGITFFSNSQKIATDADAATQAALLANSAANNGWTVQDQGYTNSNRTAVTVSTAGSDANQGSGLNSLASVQAGINAVVTGGIVNVKDGTYVVPSGGSNYLDITKALTLKGQSQAGTVINASNASTYGLRVQADNVVLSNFTLKGPTAAGGYGIKVEPLELVITPADRVHNFSISNVTESGSYKNGLDLNGVIGATVSNVTVSGTTNGTGIAITDSANVTLTGNTTTGNAWGGLALYEHNATYDQQVNNITVDGTNTFHEANGVYMEDESASKDFGTVSIAGYDHAVKATVALNDSYTWLQNGVQAAIDFAVANAATTASVQGWTGSAGDNHFTVGTSTNGTALSVNAALDQSAAGGVIDVLHGTYAEDVAIIVPRTVNFDDATLDSLSVLAAGGGSILSGSVKAGSVAAFDIKLGGDLSLDTSAANGTIDLANVDGAHNLTLNAGSGGAVLVGGLGATTRLGAVDITADIIGLGATNKAASFDFNGDVALSAASTVIDTTVSSTAAGDITFAGDIFGLTDGGQSLTLKAGPGIGAKSANGDIAMNNAGISSLRLGSLTVSGDDFTALTVDLAGGFTSQLTGNQLFAADTLNAAGDVNSNVAGNIGGHIVSGGNVNLTATGAVSGNITGKVVSLTGQTVNSQVTANTLNVNAVQGGTITGTFTPGTVSNGLVVNGITVGSNTGTGGTGTGGTGTGGTGNTGTGGTGTGGTGTGGTGTGGTGGTGTGGTGTGGTGTGGTGTGGTGNTANNFPNVNLQQLVVEGFALPVGTQIGANGQLILPAGTVLGLLSPGGGTPRVIMVQTVQELGALLDQGYVAIVIDLTGHKKATKVASN